MRLPESVTKIQPVGAVLKASEAGAALTLDRAEALHGGALELAWGEIAEG